MDQFITEYGPYGFGVVSLLLLWYAIVRPQVKIQENQLETMRQTAEANKETAMILREVTQELRSVVTDLRVIDRHINTP